MRGWLKLVGTVDNELPEPWAIERKDLLSKVRFSEIHPPDPISKGDHLVYHAVGHARMLAIVDVLDDQPTVDPAPFEWEKQWPLCLRVRPLLKIGRISQCPATAMLGELYLSHQGFVPLTDPQLAKAKKLLLASGAA